MTDTNSYEDVVKTRRDEKFAEFQQTNRGFGNRIQSALHSTPSMVPLIVLLSAVIVFGFVLAAMIVAAPPVAADHHAPGADVPLLDAGTLERLAGNSGITL